MALKNLIAILLAFLNLFVFHTGPVTGINESTPAVSTEDIVKTSAHWETVCAENERCIAADTDGTHFLILTDNFPEATLSVLNIRTGKRIEVFFSGLTNGEIIADSCMRSVLGRQITDTQKEAMLKKYGSPENLLAKLGWKGVKAKAAGGDYFLVESGLTGFVRIDIRTGEALHLEFCSLASMNKKGDLALFFSRERRFYIVPADTAVPEEFRPAVPPSAQVNALCLLSDGSVWLAESILRPEKITVNGKETLVSDTAFACYGQDGKEQGRVDAGCIRIGFLPQNLLYSEETDTGIASCINNGPVWIFNKADDTAGALAPQSLIPPILKKAERNEVADEVGVLLKDARHLYPIGLSASGEELLLMDADSSCVISVYLNNALGAEVVLPLEQIVKLIEEKPEQLRGFMFLADMYYNGTDLLCNPYGSSMIRLGDREWILPSGR